MVSRIGGNLFIICLYCFPFVFFSMYKDFEKGSMIGYLIMIIITSLLAFFGKRSNYTIAVIVGNLASAFVSYHFISTMSGDSRWTGAFFNPFGPMRLFILLSFLNLIPQLVAMKLALRFEKRV